jgi:hypothetical protein
LAKPRLSEFHDEGAWGAGKLTLVVKPERIDWVLAAPENVEAEPGPIAVLGEYAAVVKEFSSLVNKWFESCSLRFSRLAFGATLMQTVKERAEGYRLLAEYLPSVSLQPDVSSDFLFQINRPRVIDTEFGIRIEINRLSKWFVARSSIRRVAVGPSGAMLAPEIVVDSARVELDINTSANYEGTYTGAEAVQLFPVLVGLATEVAEVGDIP